MALSARQQQRLRSALEGLLRAEEHVAAVADDLARSGDTSVDVTLDRTADLLRAAIAALAPLTDPGHARGGRRERGAG